MALDIVSVVVDAPNGLKLAGNRYTVAESANNADGLTLLFAHCIGAHKEQWEPIIERLFRGQQSKGRRHQIRQAWCFDWQSHGDSAILNEEALVELDGVPLRELASSVAVFVRSHLYGHRIVALGHSAGCGMLTLSLLDIPLTELPYIALILIEPTMIAREMFYSTFDDRIEVMAFTFEGTLTRRKTWASREEALNWMSKRFPWSTWDPRVVRIHVDHGLKDTPDGQVQLKCDPRQEAFSYPDVDGHFDSFAMLSSLCGHVAVHLIWGSDGDLVSDYIQDSLRDETQGRFIASVRQVEDAGHFTIQQQPNKTADVISDILNTIETQMARL